MGFGELELLKKDSGHPEIIMLAGVDDQRMDIRVAGESAVQRRDFHKIGTCPNDIKNFQDIVC